MHGKYLSLSSNPYLHTFEIDHVSLQAGDIVHDPLMRRLERCHMVPVGRPLQSAPSPHGHLPPSSGSGVGHYLPPSSGSGTLLANTALRGPSFQTSLCLTPGAQFPPAPRVPLLLTSSCPPSYPLTSSCPPTYPLTTSCPPSYPLLQGSPFPLDQVTTMDPGPHLPGQYGRRQVNHNFIRRWCTNRYRRGSDNFYSTLADIFIFC